MPVCQKIVRGKCCGRLAYDFVVFAGLNAVALRREHAPINGVPHGWDQEAALLHPIPRKPPRRDLVQEALEQWADSVNSG